MRIAILYTGEVRTIEKTIPYLYAHILDPNPDAHLFVTVQARTTEDETRYQEIIENNIPFSQLKSLQWFKKEDPAWQQIQNTLISNITTITDQWKNYLKTSGSMIEYYQLYLSYLKMVEYEQTHGFQYDYVMRFRTDTVLNKPLDFAWTEKTIPEIQQRMREIQTVICGPGSRKETITPKHIYYYMNSLFDNNRIYYLEDGYRQFTEDEKQYSYYKNDTQIQELLSVKDDLSLFYSRFQKYIQTGNYLISLRKNVIYFAKRDNFHFIPCLGFMYGTFRDATNPYWFNSENQFQYCCMTQKMTIFDSRTELEDKSLYEYNVSNYFGENEEVLKDDSSFFFVLCRK
jgi:hypothetical protein